MDPDTDVCQTEQPQISYSFDFTAEQSRAIQSPIITCWVGSREGTRTSLHNVSGFNFIESLLRTAGSFGMLRTSTIMYYAKTH